MFNGRVEVGDKLMLGPNHLGEFRPALVMSIHTKQLPVRSVHAGQSCSFGLKLPKGEKLKRATIRKGAVLTSPSLRPQGVFKFEAEVLILHHPTTIHENYQPVVHTGTVRQSARIVSMQSPLMRTGDRYGQPCAVNVFENDVNDVM